MKVAVRTAGDLAGAPRRRPTSQVDGPAGALALLRGLLLTQVRRAGELVGEPVGGVRALGERRGASAARSARSAAGIVSARWSASAVPTRSKGGTGTAPACSRSHAPASGRERQHRVAVVHEHPLGRDEVEAVADRVHEEHVGAPEQRDRPRVVVLDVEHDRLPVVRRPTGR